MERVDDDGRWVSTDGGVSWALVEPSAAWLAARDALPAPAEPADPVATLLAVLADAQSLEEVRQAAAAVVESGG